MKTLLFVILIVLSIAYSSALFGSIFNRLTGKKAKHVKDQCPIKLYDPKDSSFTGVKLYANAETFHPLLAQLSKYAKECRVVIRVKEAFVQENSGLTGFKINDQSDMAFRLGQAIDFELLDHDKKLLCNNLCVQKELSQLRSLPDAKCFLEKVSRNPDFRQDAIKPNILFKRPHLHESLTKLQDKRKEIQDKCSKLKIES